MLEAHCKTVHVAVERVIDELERFWLNVLCHTNCKAYTISSVADQAALDFLWFREETGFVTGCIIVDIE